MLSYILVIVNTKIRYFQKYFYRTYVRLFIVNQNICSILGKMGKNRLFKEGRTKNQNVCSVFPAAYKLLHLHTNFILKHLNKNLIKPSKIKHLINLYYQTLISHPISSNPTKIHTFTNLIHPIPNHNPNHFLPI